MAKLTVTTHHHASHVHEIEVEDDYALPSAEKDWFVFSGKNGAKLSVHERNVSAISLTK